MEAAEPLGGGENPAVIQTFTEPYARTAASGASGTATAGNPQLLYRKKRPAGPQLWAVCFTIFGFYYFWTRVLGRTIRFPHRAHRVGSKKGHGTTTDTQTARERRLAALENANRAREEKMAKQTKDNGSTMRERTNVNTNSGNLNSSSKGMTIQERQRINQREMQERQKQQELEEKKKKQRQLYLRQKALKEKEEEERRKDEELGPGWRAREDPRSVTNLLEQQENKGGGYKPQMCTRKSG
eukprot:CAMPEP_0201690664 /NCGR_PEP_ID=MMETSP0578-20130828/4046_1 /ASSEMBLY_ACC=CAM_ASM_000663 /TAXON_ID=267565 /ORGANISM="Skeletonema grethea, Strain CCMP 1804" /LENGTH=240 /DNA_ID=CAMNT_0048175711 /DNA_START=31 /DNA_END=753 /DNA_ORIENTATION=-